MEYLGSIGDNHQTKNWESPRGRLRGNIEEPTKGDISKNANRVRNPVERQSRHLATTTKEPKEDQYFLFGVVPTNTPKHPTVNMERRRYFCCGLAVNYRHGRYETTCWNGAQGPCGTLPKQFKTKKMRVPSFDPSRGVGTIPTVGGRSARDRKSAEPTNSSDFGSG